VHEQERRSSQCKSMRLSSRNIQNCSTSANLD
jgi:hypothetical protein